MSSTRSRRLRKKLYLDEFTVLGFEFSCELNVNHEGDFDSLLDQFLEFIEGRKLCMSGGGNTESFNAFICSEDRYGSPTNEDLAAVTLWLQSNSSVKNVTIGQLVDANYGI